MLSALPKTLNGPSFLTWRSAMSSIIFGPFRLLTNVHLFNWLFRWPVGVDMWHRSRTPEVRIWRPVREKIRRILNLPKTFKVRTLSNSNVIFVTSLNMTHITWRTHSNLFWRRLSCTVIAFSMMTLRFVHPWRNLREQTLWTTIYLLLFIYLFIIKRVPEVQDRQRQNHSTWHR